MAVEEKGRGNDELYGRYQIGAFLDFHFALTDHQIGR